MSDPGFVAASYAIALGGLIAYAGSVARRARSARRTAQLLERERERILPQHAVEPSATVTGNISGPR